MTSHPSDDRLVALRSIFPDEIDWRPFAEFPPEARLAVLGNPAEPGMDVIRVRLPGGVKLMPHRHPENRIYTVISGIFYVGVDERFKADALTSYPPCSVNLLPAGTSRFHFAKSRKYVTQVMGLGPLGIEYLNLGDDPRKSAAN